MEKEINNNHQSDEDSVEASVISSYTAIGSKIHEVHEGHQQIPSSSSSTNHVLPIASATEYSKGKSLLPGIGSREEQEGNLSRQVIDNARADMNTQEDTHKFGIRNIKDFLISGSHPGLYQELPTWANIIVSFLIILSHACFLYGQIAVMWRLFFRLDVDVVVGSVPGTPLHRILHLLHLDNDVPIKTTLNNTIETFTYMSAIQGLWEGASQVPNPEWRGDAGPGFGGKVAAVILILFSAIWPHVKLLSLHVMWYNRAIEPQKRSAILYWLDYGGKWSMCDVMVICLMLSVLNVDIPLNGDSLLTLLKRDVNNWINTIDRRDPETLHDISRRLCQLSFLYNPEACENAVCSHPQIDAIDYDTFDIQGKSDSDKCKACICILEKSFPTISLLLHFLESTLEELTLKGSAKGILRVAGEAGIYIFCVAVIISLLLSTFVDFVDHKLRGVRVATVNTRSLLQTSSMQGYYIESGSSEIGSIDSLDSNNNGNNQQPFLMDRQGIPRTLGKQTFFMTLFKRVRVGNYQGAKTSRYIQVLSVVTMFICIISCYAQGVFERTVPGSIATILREELDVSLDRTYSLSNLVALTGDYGGYDLFLMTIFGLFVMVGPMVRGTLECILAVTPLPPRIQIYVTFLVSLLGSFSAWDVFLVALLLVFGEMPHITGMIVPPLSPPCKALADLGFGDFCLEIGLGIRWPFALIFFSMISLTWVSVRLVRATFIVLDPFGEEDDRGGPPLPCGLEDKIFGKGKYDEN